MAKTKSATTKKTVKKTTTKKTVAKKAPAKKVVKKTVTKKTVAKKAPQKIANNKSKIAPYKSKKNEKYMSAAMKRHFVAVLLLWKEHLIEEEFAFELRTRDRERKLISKIAVSLEKIKQDDYGWCDACGDEIGIKRLEARPTATHCIHCKTLDEIKEKQLSG
ncbi:MAG: RNA polymerase-binding protein DksA [Proteobacteria bacterium]|nr:RNA polymerase-binding protein DksA [Pseudomonadota bacterium]